MHTIFLNPKVGLPDSLAGPAAAAAARFASSQTARDIQALLALHVGFGPAPLVRLDALASRMSVGKLWVKDERERWSLGSFKAMGGAYAVLSLAAETLSRRHGRDITAADILRGSAPRATLMTIVSATAGNHGRAVAFGAQLAGARAVIFVPDGVPGELIAAIAGHGAEIVQVHGNYEAAFQPAVERSKAQGWYLVADVAFEGYEEIPSRIMQGYAVSAAEALAQIDETPTHIFVQAGAGGLAAPLIAYFAANCSVPAACVVVEAQSARCLLESARRLQPVVVDEGPPTIMGRLDCHVPSTLAWPILAQLADAFVAVEDDAALRAAQELANEGLATTPTGAAGLAGVHAILSDRDAQVALRLDRHSRVLIFVTEQAAALRTGERIAVPAAR